MAIAGVGGGSEQLWDAGRVGFEGVGEVPEGAAAGDAGAAGDTPGAAPGHAGQPAPSGLAGDVLRSQLESRLAALGADGASAVADAGEPDPGTATMREALTLVFRDERTLGVLAGVTRHDKSPQKLFDKLLADDCKITDLEVMDLVWAATDHGRIGKREMGQLNDILREHPDRFTRAGREGLAAFLDDYRSYHEHGAAAGIGGDWPFIEPREAGESMLELWHEKNLEAEYGPNWRTGPGGPDAP
jgi:hypothetical protein